MDECLQLLMDRIDSGLDLQNLIPSERIAKLIRIRLEMQVPYLSKWPQALSIQVSFSASLCFMINSQAGPDILGETGASSECPNEFQATGNVS